MTQREREREREIASASSRGAQTLASHTLDDAVALFRVNSGGVQEGQRCRNAAQTRA